MMYKGFEIARDYESGWKLWGIYHEDENGYKVTLDTFPRRKDCKAAIDLGWYEDFVNRVKKAAVLRVMFALADKLVDSYDSETNNRIWAMANDNNIEVYEIWNDDNSEMIGFGIEDDTFYFKKDEEESGVNTYGMTNVEIVEDKIAGATKTFLVYADTERFGEHEIMAQLPTYKEAVAWLRANGVEYGVIDRLEKELSTGGKVQIANTMFRRIYREKDGSIWGYSASDGWRDISRAFDDAVMTGADTAKTKSFGFSYQQVKTIKFGAACTW